MAATATATGVPQDTAKKRKVPPSANEIFTDTVAVTAEPTYNGDRAKSPTKNVYVSQSSKVFYILIATS